MKPKTLSASSLSNWEECQGKFLAVNVQYVEEYGDKNAAKVGTTVHYALEHFVRDTCMNGTHSWTGVDESGQQVPGGLDHLLALMHEGYKDTFGSANKRSEHYKDALKLTKDWYARTDLSGWTIDSVEQKKRIPLGETGILLTYIYDRVQRKIDEDGRRILWITDYKSERRTYSYDELRDKLQARIYAVAGAIEYREWQPDEIWVELDMLRHTPVAIEITREENQETWDYLMETAHMILATPEESVKRTVGSGCGYCPVKATCAAVQSNIAAGGVMSLDIEEMIEMHAQLSGQAKALSNLVGEMEGRLEDHFERIGSDKFTSASGRPVKMVQGGRRELSDVSRAADIIGPELMKMFGKLNIGDVEKLLDSEQITGQQKAELRRLIYRKPTKASIKVGDVPAVKKK